MYAYLVWGGSYCLSIYIVLVAWPTGLHDTWIPHGSSCLMNRLHTVILFLFECVFERMFEAWLSIDVWESLSAARCCPLSPAIAGCWAERCFRNRLYLLCTVMRGGCISTPDWDIGPQYGQPACQHRCRCWELLLSLQYTWHGKQPPIVHV